MAERTPLSELLIVDTDVHVHESPGALAPYCDPPWDVALRAVADVPERYLDIPGFSPAGDAPLPPPSRPPTRRREWSTRRSRWSASCARSTSTSPCCSPTTC